MKNSLFIVVVALVLSGCGTESKNAENTPEKEVENTPVTVIPNRMLTMEIDGMVCQMGCGGSIRKELTATGGVSGVEFDFEDERAMNIAKISFDKNLVSVDEMIKVLSECNDGQFTIGETSSEDIHSVSAIEENSSVNKEKSNVEVSSSNIQMPNLLDLFSEFLLN